VQAGRKRGPHQAMGLYAHLGWHTKARAFSLRERDVPLVTAAFQAAGERTQVRVHAVAVLAEHVHVMVSYPPSARLSDFVRDAKSESARRVNEARADGTQRLRWCRGCYANAVCRSHLLRLRRYIEGQREHHPDRLPLAG
jgi:REP element-mobilizing transposase RayT